MNRIDETNPSQPIDQNNGQPPVLVAQELRKSYGKQGALRGLSFSLQPGRILGFLGPNGAGKTTAIRILTTILEPTSGHFQVDGITSDQPAEIRKRIGVLPESLGFAKHMSGLECLTFFGQLYGQSRHQAKARSQELLTSVGLEKRGRSLVGSYSRGMRQRLGIARSLVNDPAVVFFDEPTLGLDPRGQQELLALVQWVAHERNTGVVLCSHALNEIEDICDDVVIMRDGQIIAQGTVKEVSRRAQSNFLRIQVPEAAVATAKQVLEAMTSVVQVTPTTHGWLAVQLGREVEQLGDAGQVLKTAMLNRLLQSAIAVKNFETDSGRLQDVFFQLTEESAIEPSSAMQPATEVLQ